MKKRQLGKSNLFVSEIGLGCMSLGTDAKAARTIIDAALEEGINYFDTADLYDFGNNEQIVGNSLKNVREQVIIATKAGNRWNEAKDGWSWDPSKAYIKEAVKASLKRLGTDYIDLYQLHGGTMEDPIDETIEAFEELTEEGYIRFYGISSIRPAVIREYAEKSKIVSVMMQFSMLDRRPEEEALPLLAEKQISVVTRGSLAKGLLSDQMLEKASASVKKDGYLDYSYHELTQVLSALKEKLAKNRSLAEIAFHYNLSFPAVASIVAGASSVQQVRENVKAINSSPLTEEEISLIRSLTKASQY
ncbi:oxidoreductase [Bacillus canaveralius]|uniref:Oxidoreductase n=1 Tax=Bacillus canaveralius TaxID=1403243 RepID=A0A2N5GRM0_9BACI|nr:aldo/keto reductase [Bacillus canaveralius]PLR86063.1 oxidoreductase [Bacillus canaveralius]PLS00182.1 oxidoreductase [Bacillus canaveralius]